MIHHRTKFTAVIALLLLAGQARAGNAPVVTPANVAPLPNIIYRVALYSDMGDFSSYPTTVTSVVVTPLSGTCNYQVEWVDSGGSTNGYTGGAIHENANTLVLASNGVVSQQLGPVPLPINDRGFYVPFTYSNMGGNTYGYANVRTDCAANTKALVTAFMTTYTSQPTGNGTGNVIPGTIVSIPVTKKGGDNGE
jgi:hypothetical protein